MYMHEADNDDTVTVYIYCDTVVDCVTVAFATLDRIIASRRCFVLRVYA